MDDEGQGRKFQKDLNSGLVALVLLAVLERVLRTSMGMRSPSGCRRRMKGTRCSRKGRFIPCCARLSATGLLTSRIVPSYSGPPRRYYRITDEGRAVLQQWSGIWRQTRDFVDRFIEGTAP